MTFKSIAKYFSGVGKKFAAKILVSSKPITKYLKLIGSNTKSIFLSPTEENEIKKITSELPSKNSSGHDNVSNVLLKDIIVHIVEPLSYIFNQSMLTGEFPNSMKLAEVGLLYKNKSTILKQTIDPYHFSPPFPKFLKRLCISKCMTFLRKLASCMKINLGSDLITVVNTLLVRL